MFRDATGVAVAGPLWGVMAAVGTAAVWAAVVDTGGLVGVATGVVLMQPTSAMATSTARIDLVSGISATSPHLGARSRLVPCCPPGTVVLLQTDARWTVAVEHVNSVDKPDLFGLVAHHQRVSARAAAEEAYAVEQVTLGHSSG